MMRRSKSQPFRIRQNYAVVVEGKCEFWYIQMIKRNERYLNVNIEPKIPQKKKISEQYSKVMELSKDFTTVFWIIDLDAVIKESLESPKGIKEPIKLLEEYINELKGISNIEVIINNPCLEFWFLLHYRATSRYFTRCHAVIRLLREYRELSGYEKTQTFYTKQDQDIYLRLKPHLETAISNSKKLQPFSFDSPNVGISQMEILFKYLKPGSSI